MYGGNERFTDYFTADIGKINDDIRDVFVNGILAGEDKEEITAMIEAGLGNSAIATYLSDAFSRVNDVYIMETGEEAAYLSQPGGVSIEIEDKYSTTLSLSWKDAALICRALHRDGLDGFTTEQPEPESPPSKPDNKSEREPINPAQDSAVMSDPITSNAPDVAARLDEPTDGPVEPDKLHEQSELPVSEKPLPEPELAFEEISQTVMARVLDDVDYQEVLSNATNRGALRVL